MGANLDDAKLRKHLAGIADAVLSSKAKKSTTSAPDLADAGKLAPAKGKGKLKPVKGCGCSKSEDEDCDCGEDENGEGAPLEETTKSFVEIVKASDEEQTVTGVVLQPEVVDGQGDIYSSQVVKEAAYNFLAGYNKTNKLGRQHADFKNWDSRFALVESYLAPMEFALNSRIIKAGSWLMTVKVLDAKVWKAVKDGKITGFSIGGKAKVKNLSNQTES